MRAVDLILKKKRGEAMSKQEIDALVRGFTKGDVPDYQMAAWMMAVCFQGMNGEETAALTDAMIRSGETVDLSMLPGVKVDKHSTGGVGDTTTLVIAPLVAACGGTVAKMSGRGLGHTGGTLDKLESVPGVSIELTMERFLSAVREIGLCVMGQTDDLVPADKLMYALRDVTGTVSSIPLIASSVMSKKIASGADAIVLDVKMGSGAFMQTLQDARSLAETMVEIGSRMGRRTVAVITDMNQPLGMAVGNGLEVKEAIELLSGKIPESDPLYAVSMLLASHMLMLAGLSSDEAEAKAKLKTALKSGAGLRKFSEMLAVLGGDTACIEDPEILCRVREKRAVYLDAEGYISAMQAEKIGTAAQLLGAGRATKTDTIDPAVGLVMHKRRGMFVGADEPVATLYINDASRVEEAVSMLKQAITISADRPKSSPMVYDVVTAV
ncbi:MAG: thymidine phosphorylase [Clostridiales bacterium]|nr:thymidine phosphorylase [Clostridiales bacterium]